VVVVGCVYVCVPCLMCVRVGSRGVCLMSVGGHVGVCLYVCVRVLGCVSAMLDVCLYVSVCVCCWWWCGVGLGVWWWLGCVFHA